MDDMRNGVGEKSTSHPVWLVLATLALAVTAFIALLIQPDQSLILYEAF
jgi:hypothetical protein